MTRDEEHVRLLSIFHYIVAGLAGLCALFPVIHLVIGLVMVFVPEEAFGGGPAPPRFIGWFFVAFAGGFIALGLTLAVLIVLAGVCLGRHSHYMYCLVVAGLECLFMPVGTVLGVFTIVVLMRDSVKALFAAEAGREPTASA